MATLNGNVAHLTEVVIGQDDGQSVQIIHGLNASDRVIQDPPDSLIEGEPVCSRRNRRCALSRRASNPVFAARIIATTFAIVAAFGVLVGCKPVGPNYKLPEYTAPAAYKESGGR